MTIRDIYNRCVTCGRLPSQPCCADCPHPEEDVNTEAVNQ